MAVRWKDKTDIGTLASGDRMPVTDVDDANTDKYTTPAEISAFVLTGHVIGTDIQAWSANLDGWSAEDPADYSTTAEANALYQPLDSDLTAIAALTTTSFGHSVLELANAAALADAADLGTGDSPQFTALNIGHASDTTLSRAAAGELAVEGNRLAKREPAVNAQTGTSYTLALSDAGGIVTMSNGSANELTIPTNASVAFPLNTVINVIMLGAGTTSITGATGVTVNGVSAGSGDIQAQYQGVSLLKIATNTWLCSGDIGPVA